MEKLDIVKLIEKNPLTRLNKDYQNILIKKYKKDLVIINNSYLLLVFIVI